MRKRKKQFDVRRVGAESVPLLIEIQEEMLRALPDPEWYVASGEEELFREAQNGQIYGVYDGDIMAAYAIITPPGLDPDGSYALRLGLPEEGTLDFQDVVVRVGYRRQGIHGMLLRMVDDMARERGAHAVYCTVSVNNAPSYRNFERAGYQRVCVKPAYDGRLRAYYRKSYPAQCDAAPFA